MAKSVYVGANLVTSSDSFGSLLNIVNQQIFDMSSTVVTVSATTGGDSATGNGEVIGIFSANTFAVIDTLRGGTVDTPGLLTIGSNVHINAVEYSSDANNSFANTTLFSNTATFTGGFVTSGATVATFGANSVFTGEIDAQNGFVVSTGGFDAQAGAILGGDFANVSANAFFSANVDFSGIDVTGSSTFAWTSNSIALSSNSTVDAVKVTANSTVTNTAIGGTDLNVSANANFAGEFVVNTPDPSLTASGNTATFTANNVNLEGNTTNLNSTTTNVAGDLVAAANASVGVDLLVSGDLTVSGNSNLTITGAAESAARWTTPRKIDLTGDATGNTTFDGSANFAVVVDVNKAETANTLINARNITLSGDATGISAAFDASANVDIAVTVDPTGIDHDLLLNSVGNEHIDHSGVTISTGNGLSGGGNIVSSPTAIAVVANSGIVANTTGVFAHANTGMVANTTGLHVTEAPQWTTGRTIELTGDVTGTSGAFDGSGNLSFATSVSSAAVNHDSTTGFVANEHIDHSSITFTAGNGLSGGGTLAANRTFTVGAGSGISVGSTTVAVDGTVVRTSGSTITGTLVLNNNVKIQTKHSGGTAGNAFYRDTANTLQIGLSSLPTRINGSGDLLYNGNEVWHAGNDGPGSGLNADTLDGSSSADFAADSHNHSGSEITSGSVAVARIGSGVVKTSSGTGGDITLRTATGAPTGGSNGDMWLTIDSLS